MAEEKRQQEPRGNTGDSSTKIIFHVDVNSAFLSWSAVKRLKEDPGALDLRTVPSVVAGDIETRHGIVTAKSIPAKKYGIRTAEPVAFALQKCPNLILVKADFKTYREYSRAFIGILHDYSNRVEQASIDEAYMDVTEPVMRMMNSGHASGHLILPGHAVRTDLYSDRLNTESVPSTTHTQTHTTPDYFYSSLSIRREAAIILAEKIKDEIRDSLGFTVNIGISENKLLAKTASDFEKPDRIHTLWPEEVPDKLWPLPIRDLFGCGAATAARLNTLGIKTIGDAAHTDEDVLRSLLGEKSGIYIYRASCGIGSDIVHGEAEEAKGYSNELTTTEDIDRENYERLGVPMVQQLAEKVAGRLARDHVYARTIGVMVKTDSFRRRSRQTTLDESTNSGQIISATAQQLMRAFLEGPGGLFEKGDKIRLIGVSASKIDHGEYRQLSFFDYGNEQEETVSTAAGTDSDITAADTDSDIAADDIVADDTDSDMRRRQRKLDDMMEKVRNRYGEKSISKGLHGNGY